MLMSASVLRYARYLLYMSLHKTKFKFTCLSGLVAVHYLKFLDSTQPAELAASVAQLVEYLGNSSSFPLPHPQKNVDLLVRLQYREQYMLQ